MKYEAKVIVTRSRVVEVEADSEDEAFDAVYDAGGLADRYEGGAPTETRQVLVLSGGGVTC